MKEEELNLDDMDNLTDKETTKGKKKMPVSTLVDKVSDDPYRQVHRLVHISEQAMNPRVSVWKRHRRKYRRGLSYLIGSIGEVPLYFTNYIFSIVETIRANMLKNLPSPVVRPRGENDAIAANIMTTLLQDSLKRANLKKASGSVLQQGLVATLGWFKVWYDPDIDGGRGNNVVESVPPEDMLIDPIATDPDNARWIIHRHRNVPGEQIYATYGKYPDLPEIGVTKVDDYLSDDTMDLDGAGELRNAIAATETFDVYECWIRVWDKDYNWHIVTIAGKTELRNEPSDYEHGHTPFVPWFDGEDDAAENFYARGVGEIEEIEPLQDRADVLDVRIYKAISLMSNRQKYVALQSGLTPSMIDNTSGRVYGVSGDPQKAVYYDSPPSLSTDVYGYRNQTEMLIQTVSGVFDVTQGRRPVGIVAGKAVDSLKQSADTRIAYKANNFVDSIGRVSELCLRNILQYFDGEKILKATDAGQSQYYRILSEYPEALQDTERAVVGDMGQPLDAEGNPAINPEDVQYEDLDENDPKILEEREMFKQQNGINLVLSDITFEWDIDVDSDTALPSARADRAQLAGDLFRLGGIDRKALLEAVDFPDREAILNRLAAEATGKTAGQHIAEAGAGGQQGLEQIMAMLQQQGIDPNMIQQLMQSMGQPNQGGNYQPQGGM